VGVVPMSDEEIYVWMLERDDGAPRPPAEQRLQLFRERLAGFGGVVPVVAGLLRPDVDHRSLNALLVPAPWHLGRVVLIGDAAHATTPHIAYGAGMAIEDSVAERVGGRPARRPLPAPAADRPGPRGVDTASVTGSASADPDVVVVRGWRHGHVAMKAEEERRSMQEVARTAIAQYVADRPDRLRAAIARVRTEDAELLARPAR
jgi:hypothetical protein